MDYSALARADSYATFFPQPKRDSAKAAREDKVIVRKTAGSFAKGFLIGYGLRVLFKALPHLIKAPKGPELLKHLWGVLTSGDSVRFGLFIGSLLSLVKSGMYATRKATGVLEKRRAIPIGVLAGGASILMLPAGSRMPIALFFFVRALEIAVRYQVLRGRLPSFEHADTVLMMLSSAQVLWAWIFHPKYLDLSYERFLDMHGGRHPAIKSGVAALLKAETLNVDAVAKAIEKGGNTLAKTAHLTTCDLLHPEGPSCSAGLARFWVAAYKRALPVYVPVFVLPMLIFNAKKLLTNPVQPLQKTGEGILRSSLFLSMYCTQAWLAVCLYPAF
eukprot:TRINITY_DN2600_c0_g1_i1.p1 TRINITY_DN2600_c0_g1~~TRINITY_DN2600_c0_g1_i1.p1  ORF type:complete len:331 (+),score=62.80 TRINITY_DN2600_c0_g1_i1:1-993(+)